MDTQKYTIGQALRKIKKLKGELAKHNERAIQSLLYNEKTPPAFSYAECIKTRDAARTNLVALSTAVALANAYTRIKCDAIANISLAGALRELQEIKAQINEYQQVEHLTMHKDHKTTNMVTRQKLEDVYNANGDFTGQRRVDVEEATIIICELTIGERVAAVEKLETRFESLNNAVEKANHETLLKPAE